jgi:hypothetical protein
VETLKLQFFSLSLSNSNQIQNDKNNLLVFIYFILCFLYVPENVRKEKKQVEIIRFVFGIFDLAEFLLKLCNMYG